MTTNVDFENIAKIIDRLTDSEEFVTDSAIPGIAEEAAEALAALLGLVKKSESDFPRTHKGVIQKLIHECRQEGLSLTHVNDQSGNESLRVFPDTDMEKILDHATGTESVRLTFMVGELVKATHFVLIFDDFLADCIFYHTDSPVADAIADRVSSYFDIDQ